MIFQSHGVTIVQKYKIIYFSAIYVIHITRFLSRHPVRQENSF